MKKISDNLEKLRLVEGMIKDKDKYPFLRDIVKTAKISWYFLYAHFPKEKIYEIRGRKRSSWKMRPNMKRIVEKMLLDQPVERVAKELHISKVTIYNNFSLEEIQTLRRQKKVL